MLENVLCKLTEIISKIFVSHLWLTLRNLDVNKVLFKFGIILGLGFGLGIGLGASVMVVNNITEKKKKYAISK